MACHHVFGSSERIVSKSEMLNVLSKSGMFSEEVEGFWKILSVDPKILHRVSQPQPSGWLVQRCERGESRVSDPGRGKPNSGKRVGKKRTKVMVRTTASSLKGKSFSSGVDLSMRTWFLRGFALYPDVGDPEKAESLSSSFQSAIFLQPNDECDLRS